MTETSTAPAAEKPLFFFPKWFNKAWWIILPVALSGPPVFLVIAWFGFNHQSTHVGYQPKQPVNYSHAIHAGQLGIDQDHDYNPASLLKIVLMIAYLKDDELHPGAFEKKYVFTLLDKIIF